MRIINFPDGFTSATAPDSTSSTTFKFENFANDAAFEVAYTVSDGSAYYNTTTDTVRAYLDGSWRELAVFE